MLIGTAMLEADRYSFGRQYPDQLLLTASGQIDIFRLGVRFTGSDLRIDIPIQSCRDSNLRIPDEQVVELVAEFDELLFSFGLLGVLSHV